MKTSVQSIIRHALTALAAIGTLLAAHKLIAPDAVDQVNAAGASLIDPLAVIGGVIAAGLVRCVMGLLGFGETTLPEQTTEGPDDTTARETRGPRLFAWLLPVGLGGILGFSLPACAPGASGSAPQLPPVPIHATYHKGGLTVGYDSKGGLSVDQDSGK